jgi:hypothetical protein
LVLLGLALLAGAIVWVLSIRVPRPPTTNRPIRSEPASERQTVERSTEEADAAPASSPYAAADSFAYAPIGVSDGLDIRTRLLGIVGLVALIVLTSAAVALGVWMLGHAIGLQFSHFANG